MTASRERGFSLTELVLVLAVTGMVAMAAIMLLQAGTQAYRFGSQRVEVQQDTRAALEWFMRVVRLSSSVIDMADHDVTLIDPGGMRVTYANPQVTFTALDQQGVMMLNNGRDQPHLIRGLTVKIGPFESTAYLRNVGVTGEPQDHAPCSRGSYIPGGWNVFCR